MRKYISGILFLLIGLGLASCMGESGEKTTHQRFGVAMLQPVPSLYTTDGVSGHIITSPGLDSIQNLKDGDCFLVDFRANLSSQAKEAYDVEIRKISPVPLLTLKSTDKELPDSIATKDEQFFTPSIRKSQLIRGRLFLQVELKERHEIQTERFEFKYNPDSLAEVNGRRIYDLYLRAFKEGVRDSIYGKWVQTEALLLEEFIKDAGDTERQAGNDSLHIRLNYPNMFNLDSTLIRWTTAELYSILL